jgi:hypothetical protein
MSKFSGKLMFREAKLPPLPDKPGSEGNEVKG